MPNVSWLEPQNLADLLAMNLFAARSGMDLGEDNKKIGILSPWFREFDLTLSPTGWHQQLKTGEFERKATFQDCLHTALDDGWKLSIAVLPYDDSASLSKPRNNYKAERKILHGLREKGASVFLVDNLHAKGIISPLAVVSGSTNYTHGGMHYQLQNSIYFSNSSSEYASTKRQLETHFCNDPFLGTLIP
jgi:hypothetical protein